jgi:ABC-type multidrug transport system fused ATPase/permease subunit
MPEIEIEEEEFTSEVTWTVLKRIAGVMKPHTRWVVGFLVTIALTSALDSFFTYLSKQIIDQGIIAEDIVALKRLAVIYGGFLIVQSGMVFGFIYCWFYEFLLFRLLTYLLVVPEVPVSLASLDFFANVFCLFLSEAAFSILCSGVRFGPLVAVL